MITLKWSFIAVGGILATLFSILNYKYKPYKDWSIKDQKLWRSLLIIVPMIALLIHIFDTGIKDTYPVLILAMLSFALIGDLLIITSLIYGLVAFLGCHAINSLNFLILNPCYDKNVMLLCSFVYAFGIYIYLMLFLGKIKGLMGALVPIYLVVILYSTWRSYALFYNQDILFASLASIGTTLFFFTDVQVANEALNNTLVMGDYRINLTINNIFYYGSLLALSSSALVF